jgi:hypothetical protein
LCPFCPHICPFFNSPPLFSHARGIFCCTYRHLNVAMQATQKKDRHPTDGSWQ